MVKKNKRELFHLKEDIGQFHLDEGWEGWLCHTPQLDCPPPKALNFSGSIDQRLCPGDSHTLSLQALPGYLKLPTSFPSQRL